MADNERAPVGYGNYWKEQELITFDDIKMMLDANLKIESHPIPDGMIGSLYTIDGKIQVSESIMNWLERRSKLFNGYTKPHKEEENGERKS